MAEFIGPGGSLQGFRELIGNAEFLHQKMISKGPDGIGRQGAEALAVLLERNIKKYVPTKTWRLYATIGTYQPELIRNEVIETFSKKGSHLKVVHTAEQIRKRTKPSDAVKIVRRHRASEWSATIGTLTPYAQRVNDGAVARVQAAYGGGPPTTIHYRGHHFMEKGRFDTEHEAADILERTINENQWYRWGRG